MGQLLTCRSRSGEKLCELFKNTLMFIQTTFLHMLRFPIHKVKMISTGYHATSLATQASVLEVFHENQLFLPLDFIMRKWNGFEL